jgi:cytoskeletal protein RodZ
VPTKTPPATTVKPPPPSTLPVPEETPKKKSFKYLFQKKLVLIIFIFILVIGLLIFLTIATRKKTQTTEVQPSTEIVSPTPTVTESFRPSAFASDSAVLSIESDINNLESKLLETDLYETALNPPELDMNVHF